MTRPPSQRTIRQPGPPTLPRIAAVPAGAVPIDTLLPPGQPLLAALSALLTNGIESACLHLSGGALYPFSYVIPALSPDGSQAAFYSETFHRPALSPDGSQAAFYSEAFRHPDITLLQSAAVTVGWRGTEPFFHCHALWTGFDSRQGCGHVLPDGTTVATLIRARGVGLVGARFEVHPDPETGFNLLTPRPTGTPIPPGARRALALRLAPNQDLIETLEHAARTAGFPRATLHGGVGSTNEVRLHGPAPARRVPPAAPLDFATELLVQEATVRGTEGPPSVVEIAVVDLHGTIAHGYLVPGDNPVLMTFEAVLEEG